MSPSFFDWKESSPDRSGSHFVRDLSGKEGDLGGDLELKWDPGVRKPSPNPYYITKNKKYKPILYPKAPKID